MRVGGTSGQVGVGGQYTFWCGTWTLKWSQISATTVSPLLIAPAIYFNGASVLQDPNDAVGSFDSLD